RSLWTLRVALYGGAALFIGSQRQQFARQIGRQAPFGAELLEVRPERQGRRDPQVRSGGEVGVAPGSLEQIVLAARARGERIEHPALALAAVLQVLGELRAWIPDDRTVPRADRV